MLFSFVIILVAIAAWGVVHSLLASRQAKKLTGRLAPSLAIRWYRLGYNLFAGVSLLPIFALAALLPDRRLYVLPLPWAALCVMIQLGAVVAVLYGVRQTGASGFLGLSQLFGKTAQRSQLVTGGLYRWIRHPLYSAGLVFIWLSPVMTTNLLALNLGLTAYILAGIKLEERKLADEFGAAYEEYRERTPMLVPFIKPG